jgi:hypothetical protein
MDMTSWNSFLATVLPEQGYYCIGSYKEGTEPLTEFADTVEGTEQLIQNVLDLKRDTYFGCAKFITNKNRKAKNVGWVKQRATQHICIHIELTLSTMFSFVKAKTTYNLADKLKYKKMYKHCTNLLPVNV